MRFKLLASVKIVICNVKQDRPTYLNIHLVVKLAHSQPQKITTTSIILKIKKKLMGLQSEQCMFICW